jgi:hypothetical protein
VLEPSATDAVLTPGAISKHHLDVLDVANESNPHPTGFVSVYELADLTATSIAFGRFLYNLSNVAIDGSGKLFVTN